MHHSDCGMTHFHDATVKQHLYEISPEAGEQIEGIKRYGEILGPIEESIKEDVAFLRKSPFVKKGTAIVGLKYDVFKGTLEEIESFVR
jgi:carbonic anhydrase